MLKWAVGELNLKDFATTKSDKKKNINRMPRRESALNFAQIEQSKFNSGNSTEESKSEGRTSRSETIYSATEEREGFGLNDFKILKVLGRGTFGKVSLV